VRDGAFAARLGLPTAVIITEVFADAADLVAQAAGIPAIPRVVLEHPVSGTGLANIDRVAAEATPRLLKALAEGRA
jgi:hypothetical protein